MRVEMSKQPPNAPPESAVGPCPTVIQSVGRLGTGSLPSTIAPPNHRSDVEKRDPNDICLSCMATFHFFCVLKEEQR